MILAVDPGKKAGYCGLDSVSPCGLKLYYLSDQPTIDRWPRAVCEDQFVNHKASRQSALTLGQRAGFQLGRIAADAYYVLPVRVWHERLWVGSRGQEPKKITHMRLRQLWMQCGLPGDPPKDENVLEAFGIAIAALWLGDELEKYRCRH